MAKGAPTRKENRKVVEIQFMAMRLVSKYSAEVVDTGAYDSHFMNTLASIS